MSSEKANWSNRTMWTGDNLDVMRGMNSESVDLIYLDPPFNSNRDYAAPIGSEAAGAKFKDTWTLDDVDEAWHGEVADRDPPLYSIIDAAGLAHGTSMKSYLIMMAVRLLEMRRVLRPTGSIYLHCDPTAGHYLKTLMDAVFGSKMFRSEIIWNRTTNTGSSKARARRFPTDHDSILFYSKDPEKAKFFAQFRPYSEKYIRRYYTHDDGDGRGLYQLQALKTVSEARLEKLRSEGRLVPGRGRYPRFKDYLRDKPGVMVNSIWADIEPVNPASREKTSYPTQKPLALLDRIIRASSNKGDMILDPFAGCATACVAADKLNRQWVGIDISEKAVELVNRRLRDALGDLYHSRLVTVRTDIPQRTDLGDLPNYRTHKHQLFGKQEGNCAGCRTLFLFRNFTIDHKIPKSRGGSDHIDNLQLLCGACNSTKGDRDQAYLIAKLKSDGII